MERPKLEIRRYKKTSDITWSSTYDSFYPTEVTTVDGLEVQKDQFKLSVLNQNKSLSTAFNMDDRIQIFIYNTNSPTAQDLVLDGVVTEISHTIESGGRKLVLNGANRTHELLSNLVLIRETDETKDVRDIIEQILNQVNNNNQATAGSQRYIDFDSTSIAQTKADGTAFPKKVFIVNYKPAYDAILQFSDDEYTGDGQYIFWLDSTNKFHWQKKTSISGTGTIEEGKDFQMLTIQKGKYDVYNSIIVDVGKDAYGHGNHIFQVNVVSIIDVGAKWKFVDESTISANLLASEKAQNPNSFPKDADGNYTSHFPSSYPYYMQFQWDSDGDGTPDTTEVNSDSEFNKAIRQEAKRKGRERAVQILNLSGDPKIKAKILLNGTTSFYKGQTLFLTSETANLSSKELRIISVSHRYSNNGWITELTLEEDLEES